MNPAHFESTYDERDPQAAIIRGDVDDGPTITRPNPAAWQRVVETQEKLADATALRLVPKVRVELDAAERIVRAWVPSSGNPKVEHELVRTGDGWEHVGASCPAAAGTCYHVKALVLLDEEAVKA